MGGWTNDVFSAWGEQAVTVSAPSPALGPILTVSIVSDYTFARNLVVGIIFLRLCGEKRCMTLKTGQIAGDHL